MGEWFETIADIEATPGEADRLGAEVLSWLIEHGIVRAEPTDCILGSQGHRPGPNYAVATVEKWDDLHKLATNGFRVVTGQSVFYSMGIDQVVCPHCRAIVVEDQDNDSWGDFSPVIDEWYTGGTGVRACKHCGKPVGINEWEWSPPWGFGYLGFEFWNWPMLDPGFVAAVSNRLGHRTVKPCGKLLPASASVPWVPLLDALPAWECERVGDRLGPWARALALTVRRRLAGGRG